MREIVNLGIGSFGVRMTDPLWDKLCAEHLIDSTGKPEENKNNLEIGERKVMFHECENKEQYVPRTAILDLEDIPMSEVMKSKKDLICKSQFVHGK